MAMADGDGSLRKKRYIERTRSVNQPVSQSASSTVLPFSLCCSCKFMMIHYHCPLYAYHHHHHRGRQAIPA